MNAEAAFGELARAVRALEVRLGLVMVEDVLAPEACPASTDGADVAPGLLDDEGLTQRRPTLATMTVWSRAGVQIFSVHRDQAMPLGAFANQPNRCGHNDLSNESVGRPQPTSVGDDSNMIY